MSDNLRQNNYAHYITSMLIPDAKKRAAVVTLYEFYHEIAKIPNHVTEPLMGQIRLKWWLEKIDSIYDENDENGENIESHPIITPLADVIKTYDLPYGLFEKLIEQRWKIISPDFCLQNMDELENHIKEAEFPIILLVMNVLKKTQDLSDEQIEAASSMSIACGLADIMKNFLKDRACRRVFIPQDLILAHGLTPQKIIDFKPDAKRLSPIFKELAERANKKLKRARKYRKDCPKNLHPALLLGVVTESNLKILKASNYELTNEESFSSPMNTPFKLWLSVIIGRY